MLQRAAIDVRDRFEDANEEYVHWLDVTTDLFQSGPIDEAPSGVDMAETVELPVTNQPHGEFEGVADLLKTCE